MSALFEVHSFVNKFLTLCNNGESANLSLKCHDGKTVIDLQLHLQPVPPPSYRPQSSPPSARASPSRVRRSARRANSRAANNAEKTEQVSTDCSLTGDQTVNSAEQAEKGDASNETKKVLQSQFKDVTTIDQFSAQQAVNCVPAEQVAPPQTPPQPDHEQEQISISRQESNPQEIKGGSTSSDQKFELVCNFCDESFENEGILKDHTSIKHNSGRIRFRRIPKDSPS